jgi:phospholipid/cholesterol/gamma-HCH transport system substrate-binding protein
MATKKLDTMRLGLFVLTGAAVLIFSLFMVSQNTNLFQASYQLSAKFHNVGGLRAGNNVRFNGIEVGTVRDLHIQDDTTVIVEMTISKDMKTIIRKDAFCAIGTDGLIGNRVVNIHPAGSTERYAADGDRLDTREAVNTEEIMATLSQSNRNIAEITEKLKSTVNRINGSSGLWKILNDTTISADLHRSLAHIEKAAGNAERLTSDLDDIVSDVKAGKGTVGTLLRDSSIVIDLGKTVNGLRAVSTQAEQLAARLDNMVTGLDNDVKNSKGTLNLLLRDTTFAGHLQRSMINVEKGTADFDEDMKALQQNFLFRGYFKKKEKEKQKQ